MRKKPFHFLSKLYFYSNPKLVIRFDFDLVFNRNDLHNPRGSLQNAQQDRQQAVRDRDAPERREKKRNSINYLGLLSV